MNSVFAALSPILFAGGHGGHGEEEKHGLKELIFHHIFDSKPGEGFYYPLFNLFGVEIAITKHVLVMFVVAVLLILVGMTVAMAVRKDKTATGGRLSMLVQIFLEFIQDDILKPNFHGNEYKKWTPYFATLFFYIMLANFIGMVPFSATITGNIAVTMTLAVLTFIITQVYGMAKRGVVHYWVGLVPEGVPKPLWPMLFVIEFAGLFTKPFALTLRLFANMIAGHIVILVFLYFAAQSASSLMGLGVAPLATAAAVAVNILEVLIAVLQAYIFTFLSAIFIASAGESH